jgi:DNA-directed RNA polymerase sigma subunit (sigma70/sigma32)
LIARNGLVPSDAQVANSLGMTEKKANTVIAAIKAIALSRYDEHDPVYGMALEQFLVADADDMTSDANTNVDDKMQSIFDRVESLVASGAVDRRASEVIRLHFGIGEQRPMSLKAIGKRFGVTCEWVRRIEKTALAGLRAELAGVTT